MPRRRARPRGATYAFPDDFATGLERFKEASGLTWAELARQFGTSTLNLWRRRNGVLDKDEETARLMADTVQPIETLTGSVGRTLSIHLTSTRHDRRTLEALAALFEVHRGPGRIRLQLDLTERTPPLRVRARLTDVSVRPSEHLAKAVEQICGEGTVVWS